MVVIAACAHPQQIPWQVRLCLSIHVRREIPWHTVIPAQVSGLDSCSVSPSFSVAGDSVIELSPQSVRITAERKQKRPPRHSTAASFHEVPASSIAFYDTLIVEHPELDAPLEFSIHDPCHCALVCIS